MHSPALVRGVVCGLLLWPGVSCAVEKDRRPLVLSDTRVAPAGRSAGEDRAPRPLFRAGRDAPAALRDGIGMNYRLGNLGGGLQFNLYAPRRPRNASRSWNLNAEPPDAAAFWLLGGSLDLARNGDARSEVVFVPQLLLDFNALTERDRALHAVVQYAPWHAPPGLRGPDELMAQIALRLRF